MWAARAMFGRWSPCGKVVAPIPNNLVDLGIIYQVIRFYVLIVLLDEALKVGSEACISKYTNHMNFLHVCFESWNIRKPIVAVCLCCPSWSLSTFARDKRFLKRPCTSKRGIESVNTGSS